MRAPRGNDDCPDCFPENIDYNYFMPRPRKNPKLIMGSDLRVPVTAEQKTLIIKATSDEPNGMAAWARSVLIDAARRKLEKSSGK